MKLPVPSPIVPAYAALTIAGSDSGGGAGIQADLRAFRAFGVHGCSAITSLTAQNPHGVRNILGIPPAFLHDELACIAEDFKIGAVKTGMLLNAPLIEAAAAHINAFPEAPWVVDPVMIATSGARLLDNAAIAALRERLLPFASVITPNLPEAMVLLGEPEPLKKTPDALAKLARRLCDKLAGPTVLLKGGHNPNAPATDFLAEPSGALWQIDAPALDHPATTHGTGCTLSAAIAANLALNHPLQTAIAEAKAYLLNLLAAGAPQGKTAVYGPEGNTFSAQAIRFTALL